ncbi:MAG: Rpn family recombination-promoting nuclease/putative transposase, partial [Holosporales bacterium]|nr:Rpn family recombination-promoting nuclease/putative transposase [Holosporales bacterium]
MTELLDPKLDYIFKTIFGTEDRKPLLISFLNALFKG